MKKAFALLLLAIESLPVQARGAEVRLSPQAAAAAASSACARAAISSVEAALYDRAASEGVDYPEVVEIESVELALIPGSSTSNAMYVVKTGDPLTFLVRTNWIRNRYCRARPAQLLDI